MDSSKLLTEDTARILCDHLRQEDLKQILQQLDSHQILVGEDICDVTEPFEVHDKVANLLRILNEKPPDLRANDVFMDILFGIRMDLYDRMYAAVTGNCIL